MDLNRRDFIKLFGAAAAALLLTRCQKWKDPFGPVVTCYAPLVPTGSPNPGLDPLGALRNLWWGFGDLAAAVAASSARGEDDSGLGAVMTADHRRALDALVAAGRLDAPVAALVQEAFEAAVYHVWRSNTLITCYEAVLVDYSPAGADLLVRQAEQLEMLAASGEIDEATLAEVRAALEHDLAYYSLTDAEVAALEQAVYRDYSDQGLPVPSFSELDLDIPAEARQAADFILNLLTRP